MTPENLNDKDSVILSPSYRLPIFIIFVGLLFFDIFFDLDLVRDVTLITAGSPPNPNIPDFPGETTSILTSSNFSYQ